MRNMLKMQMFYFFLIINCFYFRIINAQTIAQTKLTADSLMANGQIDSAVFAYQRVLFFCPIKEKATIYFQLAKVAMLQNNWELAQTNFKFVQTFCWNDSLKTEAIFQSIFCKILAGKYFIAYIDLEKLRFELGSQNENKRILYQAVCLFGLSEYDKSEFLFLSLVHSNSEAANQIKAIFNEYRNGKPSPDKAFLYSFLFPGAGQVYAGNWPEAIHSFMTNAVLWTVFGSVVVKVSALDAFIGVFPWAWRFYYGGCLNAKLIVEKSMLVKKDVDFQRVLYILK